MAHEEPALVVDNGSGTCKSGFAGDHTPKNVFPSKVGHPRYHFVNHDPSPLDLKDWYVGDEACSHRQVLNMYHPVEKGLVTNWDDMEKLWRHTFNKLGVSSEERPILLTDAPNNPKANREKMAQIMFETFNTPAIFIAIQGVLSLYAYGLVTGVTVDIGAEVSQIVPTIEGNCIAEATSCLDLGGRDLNSYLMETLIENGIAFTNQNAIEDVCKIKEKLCYVALDFTKEMTMARVGLDSKKTYKLPDNQVVNVGCEQFQCPEALFQPSFLGKEFHGIHRTCYDDIIKCDDDIKKDLFSNIVLSGGSSMFPGYTERMKRELTALAPTNARVNVMAVPSRKHNVWIGGSIMAAQSAFQQMWLKKQDYHEFGPSIIHKRCI